MKCQLGDCSKDVRYQVVAYGGKTIYVCQSHAETIEKVNTLFGGNAKIFTYPDKPVKGNWAPMYKCG